MSPQRFNKIINIAKQVANENKLQFRFGCIALDKKGNIIATGTNSEKSHTYQAKLANRVNKKQKIFLHSEVQTLLRCRVEVDTLVIVRLFANNQLAMAAPCSICRQAIEISKVKKIIYSNQYGYFTIERLR